MITLSLTSKVLTWSDPESRHVMLDQDTLKGIGALAQ
jgi:hypothetical protein